MARPFARGIGATLLMASLAVPMSAGDDRLPLGRTTTRFVQNDASGALREWNLRDEPRVGAVKVEGVDRTRVPVIVNITGLQPQQLLTPERFRRAERRVAELPVAAAATLRYDPIQAGVTTVTAVVTERPVLPPGAMGWALVGLNAAVRHELVVGTAGPTGAGEAMNFGYRYGKNLPRVRGELLMPVPGKFRGILGIEAMWDRQAYVALGGETEPLKEERRRIAARVSDWATSWLRWQAGAALERSDTQNYVAVESRISTRWFGDRIATRSSWDHWTSTDGTGAFDNREVVVSWRTTRFSDRSSFVGRAGLTDAGDGAPLALWPVASSSQLRGSPLRAHRLHDDDGVVISDLLGRRLAFATAEFRRPVYVSPYGSVALAGFVDSARAWNRRSIDGSSRLQTDVGGGVRVDLPGSGGPLRIDVAYGLENKLTRFSAAYMIPWGQ